MNYCKKDVAFLDSIIEVDSRVFFSSSIMLCFLAKYNSWGFHPTSKAGVSLSGRALELVQVLVSNYHV